MEHRKASGNIWFASAVMVLTPLCFSTNLVFGRGVIDEVAPFTLAFIRWASVALILAPLIMREWPGLRTVLGRRAGRIGLLGFLGMGICGGAVYLGLQTATATNATLIYTTSPLMIILIEALFFGRRIGRREGIGCLIAFVGVAVIVLKGDPSALWRLDFTPGDLLLLAAAAAWAFYSVLYRSPDFHGVSNMALFAVISVAGAITLLPFSIGELVAGARMPGTMSAWTGIGGIVIFASLLAFSGYQYGVRRLGPSLTGIFMYLLPPYGVVLAVLLLGERFEPFHAAGIALVMGGVVLATFPASRTAERLQPSRPSAGKVSSNQ